MEKNNNYFHIPQIKKRNQKAKRFQILATSAIVVAMSFLAFFLFDIISKGYPAFKQSYVKIEISIDEETASNPYGLLDREMTQIVSRAWLRTLPQDIEKNPHWIGTTQTFWALTGAEVDQYIKGKPNRVRDNVKAKVDHLLEKGEIESRFNIIFFFTGDSKIPENAGFYSAMIGSVLTMLVTMALAVPIGIMTAIYLEEFAPDNKFTQFIEVNINNLAAIPSILFGLLGLAIFINFFGLPRSSALVGGMTLALMSLPIIIVSSKAALKAVPESIRQAGYGLGLTKWQITRDHVLPIAMPGMLTGSIIALAQAIGETAPLIIVGMIAFVPDAPSSIMSAATVMPAQIYTWSGMPELAYIEKTAAAIIVLLTVLLSLNTIAIILRKKFTKRF
ncbi:phosphate ABC transporter permease PstA [Arcobacter sp. FWKO B]|uniref:phosphate ABC transporter permease PstA n=1 Tax=Arcobacter sp. FWKO B TaxID=2593672 RepID=UPI001D18F942|nr:phosphate ABC transporter permease PstA [Arcobacter sp. FWKO B]